MWLCMEWHVSFINVLQSNKEHMSSAANWSDCDRIMRWTVQSRGDKQPGAVQQCKRTTGSQTSVEGWKVMLPTMHFLLMAIYCIIQSGQQKTPRSCAKRSRKTTPEADKTAAMAASYKQHPSRTSESRYDTRTACTFVCLWPIVCARVCAFPCLCLYIPCANRVAGSCPWISIDRECGICRVFLYISLHERAGGGFVESNKVVP